MTLGLVLIVAFILNVFQKSTYYLSLLFSLVMVYFVFIKTPDQLIALLGFGSVRVHFGAADSQTERPQEDDADDGIASGIAVNCGETIASI